jgi:hypothetical protein
MGWACAFQCTTWYTGKKWLSEDFSPDLKESN